MVDYNPMSEIFNPYLREKAAQKAYRKKQAENLNTEMFVAYQERLDSGIDLTARPRAWGQPEDMDTCRYW